MPMSISAMRMNRGYYLVSIQREKDVSHLIFAIAEHPEHRNSAANGGKNILLVALYPIWFFSDVL